MISVLRDNTKEKFYTKCKHCGSELEYNYSDITTIDIAISYHTDKRITCPICGRETLAELETKDNYQDKGFSLKQSTDLDMALNGCCTGFNSLDKKKERKWC